MAAYEAFAAVYDIFMEEVDYNGWVRHVLASWEKYGSGALARAIDLGCGTGGASVPLALMGLDVIGVDLSPEMLAEADRKARQAGVSLRLVCQDMTELELGIEADCVLSLCDSLNYLTEDCQLEQAFARAAAHIRPGGLFLFDMNTEYKFREILGDNIFASSEEDAAYIWENSYDPETRINEYNVSFFIEDEDSGLYERVQECHYERAYSLEEITHALEKSGLTLAAVCDDYCFVPPHEESERLFFVARRNGETEERK